MKPFRSLAFDMGAESGRALVGTIFDDRIEVRETARFPNGIFPLLGKLHWNAFRLFEEMKSALRSCAHSDTPPESVGIDTWGVDFVLLDESGSPIGLPFAYRDRRTEGTIDSFSRKMNFEKLYSRTGIQVLPINTLFQLESMVRDRSPSLAIAADLLFMPDLFHYLLTGIKKTEFTFATTSQLFNPLKMDWDEEVFSALGVSRKLMQPIISPCTLLGQTSGDIEAQTGFPRVPVVAVATHDTGSAVAAVPAEGEDWAFLSSGTWSLMGFESAEPILTQEAREMNFTNEGGLSGNFRILKNIVGLWLLQECRRSWAKERDYTYEELQNAAEKSAPLVSFIDPDDPAFLNPTDMPEALMKYFHKTGQAVPETHGAFVRAILESLALKYRYVLEQMRRLRKTPINRIHVIGGGSRNELLCRFTAAAAGLPVIAGPTEATALGNLLAQGMWAGRIKDIAHLRAVVRHSQPALRYDPEHERAWNEAYKKFSELIHR